LTAEKCKEEQELSAGVVRVLFVFQKLDPGGKDSFIAETSDR
jgi:polyphosphate kinase 2 (PPK2 family)